MPKKKHPSKSKAKKILEDNQVHGKPLTSAQKRYFVWVAGGKSKKRS
jgi:hypothetical protein